VSLTENCRDIIVGTILGDACLERNGKNVRLRIDHGHNQRALVEWKYQQLAELAPSTPKVVEVFDRRTNRTYIHYRFVTQTTQVLNEYFELFYGQQGVKCVPADIASYLSSALSVAVWYMDDGGRRSDCRSGYFNTQAYQVGEIDSLRDCLLKNFNLSTRMHFAAGRPRIYIAQAHFQKLCDLVRVHVIQDMQYKLL
jgi:hypothetical protein